MYIILFLFARSIQNVDKKFVYLVSVTSAILSFYGILQYIGVDFFIRDLSGPTEHYKLRQGVAIINNKMSKLYFFNRKSSARRRICDSL